MSTVTFISTGFMIFLCTTLVHSYDGKLDEGHVNDTGYGNSTGYGSNNTDYGNDTMFNISMTMNDTSYELKDVTYKSTEDFGADNSTTVNGTDFMMKNLNDTDTSTKVFVGNGTDSVNQTEVTVYNFNSTEMISDNSTEYSLEVDGYSNVTDSYDSYNIKDKTVASDNNSTANSNNTDVTYTSKESMYNTTDYASDNETEAKLIDGIALNATEDEPKFFTSNATDVSNSSDTVSYYREMVEKYSGKVEEYSAKLDKYEEKLVELTGDDRDNSTSTEVDVNLMKIAGNSTSAEVVEDQMLRIENSTSTKIDEQLLEKSYNSTSTEVDLQLLEKSVNSTSVDDSLSGSENSTSTYIDSDVIEKSSNLTSVEISASNDNTTVEFSSVYNTTDEYKIVEYNTTLVENGTDYDNLSGEVSYKNDTIKMGNYSEESENSSAEVEIYSSTEYQNGTFETGNYSEEYLNNTTISGNYSGEFDNSTIETESYSGELHDNDTMLVNVTAVGNDNQLVNTTSIENIDQNDNSTISAESTSKNGTTVENNSLDSRAEPNSTIEFSVDGNSTSSTSKTKTNVLNSLDSIQSSACVNAFREKFDCMVREGTTAENVNDFKLRMTTCLVEEGECTLRSARSSQSRRQHDAVDMFFDEDEESTTHGVVKRSAKTTMRECMASALGFDIHNKKSSCMISKGYDGKLATYSVKHRGMKQFRVLLAAKTMIENRCSSPGKAIACISQLITVDIADRAVVRAHLCRMNTQCPLKSTSETCAEEMEVLDNLQTDRCECEAKISDGDKSQISAAMASCSEGRQSVPAELFNGDCGLTKRSVEPQPPFCD